MWRSLLGGEIGSKLSQTALIHRRSPEEGARGGGGKEGEGEGKEEEEGEEAVTSQRGPVGILQTCWEHQRHRAPVFAPSLLRGVLGKQPCHTAANTPPSRRKKGSKRGEEGAEVADVSPFVHTPGDAGVLPQPDSSKLQFTDLRETSGAGQQHKQAANNKQAMAKGRAGAAPPGSNAA